MITHFHCSALCGLLLQSDLQLRTSSLINMKDHIKGILETTYQNAPLKLGSSRTYYLLNKRFFGLLNLS